MMMDKLLADNEEHRKKAQQLQDLARRITAEIQSEHHSPAVRFTLEPGEPGIFESKAGGTPYLPHDMPWPLDGQGMGMNLLAQVDCTGLAGLPDFPDTGLLQFFIAWEDVFGVSSDDLTDPSGFRVLYHETVDPTVTAQEVEAKRPPLPEDEEPEYLTPLCKGPCRICLKAPEEQGLPQNVDLFDDLFAQRWNRLCPDLPIKRPFEVFEAIPNRLRDYSVTDQPGWDSPFHQLGGYPYFTQDDPRPGRYEDLDVLLFQMDSDMSTREESGDLVMWGDAGVGNFFISRQALRRRDFSRVAYSWDCC